MSFVQKIIDKFKLKDLPIENNGIVISQYSSMPRYYIINGKKYDIDNPANILKLPVFSTTMFIDGKEYGMDSVLRKHALQSYLKNKDIYNACQDKLVEYSKAKIIFKTEEEKEHERKYMEMRAKKSQEELEKKQLHDSFKIEDMHKFSDIPFEWQWVTQLNHTNGIAWFMLNMNNQHIALSAIDYINFILEESKEYTAFNETLHIYTEKIDFFYPREMHINSIPNTFVQCIPYTKTGKISKYPAILHFREFAKKSKYSNITTEYYTVYGSIYFMADGNIGKADVTINDYWIQIRLNGLHLVVQRIGKNTENGNIDIYRKKL